MHTVNDIIVLTEKTHNIANQLERYSALAQGTRHEFSVVVFTWKMRKEWLKIHKEINDIICEHIEISQAEQWAEKLQSMLDTIKDLIHSSQETYNNFSKLNEKLGFPLKILLMLRIKLLKSYFRYMEQSRINLLEQSADFSEVSPRHTNAESLLNALKS